MVITLINPTTETGPSFPDVKSVKICNAVWSCCYHSTPTAPLTWQSDLSHYDWISKMSRIILICLTRVIERRIWLDINSEYFYREPPDYLHLQSFPMSDNGHYREQDVGVSSGAANYYTGLQDVDWEPTSLIRCNFLGRQHQWIGSGRMFSGDHWAPVFMTHNLSPHPAFIISQVLSFPRTGWELFVTFDWLYDKAAMDH